MENDRLLDSECDNGRLSLGRCRVTCRREVDEFLVGKFRDRAQKYFDTAPADSKAHQWAFIQRDLAKDWRPGDPRKGASSSK